MTGQGAAPEVGKDGSLRTNHGCAGSAEDASGSRAGQVASLLVCQANPKDDGAVQQAVSSLGPRSRSASSSTGLRQTGVFRQQDILAEENLKGLGRWETISGS